MLKTGSITSHHTSIGSQPGTLPHNHSDCQPGSMPVCLQDHVFSITMTDMLLALRVHLSKQVKQSCAKLRWYDPPPRHACQLRGPALPMPPGFTQQSCTCCLRATSHFILHKP
jgi:hypothetical protein